jgi:hypothetical protein
MSEETTSTPERKPMDMQEAVESILIKPDAPEAKPEPDEVTAAEAASTTNSENPLDGDDEAEADSAPEEEEAAVEEDDDAEEDADAEEAPTDDDEEDGQEDSEEGEEDPSDEVLFTTPDGDEVNLDELKRGYLRQSDYTKKTQDVAEGRKALEADHVTFEQNNQAVAANLEMALNVIEPQLAHFAGVNWEQLATTDAYEYAEQKALFEQAQARYSQVQQAAQKTVEYGKAQQAKAKDQYLQSEREKLGMALPDMADPKVGRKLANSIKEYALTAGLSEAEASNIADHRMIVVLNKARMYDEMNASGVTAANKKLSKGPKKLLDSGKPKSKASKSKAAKAALRSKLAKSGDTDDAVSWLLSG